MAKKTNGTETRLAVMANNIEYIKSELTEVKGEVKEVKESLEAKYVTQTEFDPVKKIVYGIVGLILTAVVGALVSLVVMK